MARTLSQTQLAAEELSLETPALIRRVDLIASGLGLLLLLPLFFIIGLTIKLTSAGPVFYKAERVGLGGRRFRLYKFRSMYLDADHQGPGITIRDDPRVTSIGRFLRRTKLDELPQLINVLLGQMSLVGPRPEDPRYVAFYTPQQRLVLAAKPGITSPASFQYRDEEMLLGGADWETIYQRDILPRKLAIDLAYLQQRSLWTDIVLILKTIAFVIGIGQNISHSRPGEFRMNPNECQFTSLQSIAEGNAQTPPQSLIRHLKLFVRRHLSPHQERTLKKHANTVIDRFVRLRGKNIPSAKPVTNVQMTPLKVGDLVRVRSKEEIEATLNHLRQSRGCTFMDVMAPYCGTVQHVLKPMERFVDERDLRVKKCKGLILLEGAICQGTTEFGRCDRSCFLFWREEWLEKIEAVTVLES